MQDIPRKEVQTFALQFLSYVKSVYREVYDTIATSKDLSDKNHALLLDAAKEFDKIYVTVPA